MNDSDHCENIGFDINLPKVEFKEGNRKKTDPIVENVQSSITNMDYNPSVAIEISSSDFPVSLIAQKLYNDKDIIGAFEALYAKYINEKDAPFMSNISSQNRKQLKTSLEKKYHLNELTNKNLLLKLVNDMDKAAFEVSELMLASFARFQSSINLDQ